MKKEFLISGVVILFILIYGCKKGTELKTSSGFKYILYTESHGKKPEIGNYVTFTLWYKNNKDSILYDSRKLSDPIRFKLEKIPFKGSFEDGLTNIGEGDSATFFVPADSLYQFLYKKRGADIIPQEKTGFIPGTFLEFNISLLKVQTDVQAEEEMMMRESEKEKSEKKLIGDYIIKNKIKVQPDSSGYYLIINKKGSGPAIDSGKVITLVYEGRFLNDSVFDGTKKEGKPYHFISGTHHVIEGWELAMKKLHMGDEARLILPSKLAYGQAGIQDPKSGAFMVPPFTPIIFDMKIISVEDAPPVSSR
jgi:FKBP-type peptidyl-prolyl cis-trans isomerase FkpA